MLRVASTSGYSLCVYGSLDVESGKSITHLEYDEAQRLELPTLIYLIDEDNHLVLPRHVDTDESARKLDELKTELKQRHTVSFFTGPDDLARRITNDLPRMLAGLGVKEGTGDASTEGAPASPWPDSLDDRDDVETEAQSGFLDWAADVERATPRIAVLLDEFTKLTEQVGNSMSEHTAAFESINRLGSGAALKAQGVASSGAATLLDYAKALKERTRELRLERERLEQNQIPLLTWAARAGNERREDARQLIVSVEHAKAAAQAARGSLEGMRDAGEGLRGISKDLNIAAMRLRPIMDAFIGEIILFEAYFARVGETMEGLLQELPE